MRGSCILLSCSLVVVALPWSAAPAHASWPHDPTLNTPLCTSPADQVHPVIAADGEGGGIVAWADWRNGGSADIYAQRVSAAGVPQWTADGVALCTAAGNQAYPMIAADGAGGAIVAWVDSRDGMSIIYAQRVSATGVPLWTTDGVALFSGAHYQDYPAIVADGEGGAIVTWHDTPYELLAYDIYAQHVSAAGVLQWGAGGLALCAAEGDQVYPTIVADGGAPGGGVSGAIVVWQDGRSGTFDIYAQRVSAAGVAQWAVDGVALCAATGDQLNQEMVACGGSGAIVVWQDGRSGTFDICAQRVNGAGVAQWTPDGVALCTAANYQAYPTIAADGADGAIVAWYDQRSGDDIDIYAQRVSAAGVPQWTADGMAICTAAGYQANPMVTADGAAGAIVAWHDQRSGGFDVYAQRVSAAGMPQWTADGVAICTATGSQLSPVLAGDGGAGAIVAWQDDRGGTDYDIYAQRVERFGYLGSPEPVIASVRDVPNDQGGRVKLSWYASWLDPVFDANLTAYDVLRSVPAGAASFALASGRRVFSPGERVAAPVAGDIVAQPLGTQTYFWEYLDSVSPLHYVEGYSYVAPTLGDSVGDPNPYTVFMVVGRNASGTMFWLSAPDSGYSVDDLAPGMPAAFTGEYAAGTSVLHWMPNGEADLNGYRLYRGATADFVPGAGNLVAERADTGYVDVAGARYYYKLCAVDVHGNASGYATLLPSGNTGVEGPAPGALALSLASANPARGSATLRWALPAEGEARLVVYDLAGRIVRELASGRASAGEHTTAWDGRDGSGVLAPAGMYVARLEAAGRGLSVRFVLVR